MLIIKPGQLNGAINQKNTELDCSRIVSLFIHSNDNITQNSLVSLLLILYDLVVSKPTRTARFNTESSEFYPHVAFMFVMQFSLLFKDSIFFEK